MQLLWKFVRWMGKMPLVQDRANANPPWAKPL